MKPEGWGPWNVRAVNALVHLPSGLELRIGIREPDGTEHWEMRWKQMARLGPLTEAWDGDSYTRVGTLALKVAGSLLALKFQAAGDLVFCLIEGGAPDQQLIIQLTDGWLGRAETPARGARAVVRQVNPDSPEARLRPVGNWPDVSTTHEIGVATTEAGLEIPLVAPVMIAAFASEAAQQHPLPLTVPPMNTAALPPTAELDEILWRGVAWNTIYHPRLRRLMTPVSRDWCVDENNFGDYVLFPWDTFFCSLLASRRDKDLAYANVRAVLAEATDRGMLPNVAGGAGKTEDRSQPPVGAYCVWKLYEKFGDRDFLAEVYPGLARWHAFWMKYRDGNGDGLLEWGSDPIPAPVDWWKPHTQQAAKWESGLDNSPMYEHIPFNEAANTLELADVGLTCLYTADAEALAKIADVLGKPEEAEAYRAEHAALVARINDLLWDEERGLYVNRHWDGRLAERYSPTSFFPMLCGAATPERAERCVREHLMNEDEFWGEWVIPSISRQDPNFPVQKYWQGRVWPPLNFLVYEGLRRYGFDAEADALAAKSEALFLKEWREEGHIHENYNAITADGDDVDPKDPEGSSDPIYTWGGLLAYIALDARERSGAFMTR